MNFDPLYCQSQKRAVVQFSRHSVKILSWLLQKKTFWQGSELHLQRKRNNKHTFGSNPIQINFTIVS